VRRKGKTPKTFVFLMRRSGKKIADIESSRPLGSEAVKGFPPCH
jgi:hypothetical protein